VIPSAASVPLALRVIDELRAQGVSVLMHAASRDGLGSMKSQFKRADASGADYALIFGDDELARGEVAVKPLRNADEPQQDCRLDDVHAWAQRLRNA
jgi:histidyl-tRNA synthetase